MTIHFLPSLAVAGTAMLIAVSSMSAFAAKKPAATGPAQVKSTQVAPTALSSDECTGMGGTVVTNEASADCHSKKACKTTDQDGKVHGICISVAK